MNGITPFMVCCGRALEWRYEEDIWAAFCPDCGRAYAFCEPLSDHLEELEEALT